MREVVVVGVAVVRLDPTPCQIARDAWAGEVSSASADQKRTIWERFHLKASYSDSLPSKHAWFRFVHICKHEIDWQRYYDWVSGHDVCESKKTCWLINSVFLYVYPGTTRTHLRKHDMPTISKYQSKLNTFIAIKHWSNHQQFTTISLRQNHHQNSIFQDHLDQQLSLIMKARNRHSKSSTSNITFKLNKSYNQSDTIKIWFTCKINHEINHNPSIPTAPNYS